MGVTTTRASLGIPVCRRTPPLLLQRWPRIARGFDEGYGHGALSRLWGCRGALPLYDPHFWVLDLVVKFGLHAVGGHGYEETNGEFAGNFEPLFGNPLHSCY